MQDRNSLKYVYKVLYIINILYLRIFVQMHVLHILDKRLMNKYARCLLHILYTFTLISGLFVMAYEL